MYLEKAQVLSNELNPKQITIDTLNEITERIKKVDNFDDNLIKFINSSPRFLLGIVLKGVKKLVGRTRLSDITIEALMQFHANVYDLVEEEASKPTASLAVIQSPPLQDNSKNEVEVILARKNSPS